MIEQVQSQRSDNYSYIIYSEDAGEAVLVDPILVQEVRHTLAVKRLKVVAIINTHYHSDHISGNSSFAGDDVEVWVPAKEKDRIGGYTGVLDDGMKFTKAGITIECLETPGHTPGSISLICDNESLICGDILFLAGCGNPNFGGNAEQIYGTFSNIFTRLPYDLRVYPGHNYAEKNLRFAQVVEPGNNAITKKLNDVIAANRAGTPPASTLAEEKTYNPFFRYDSTEIRRNLGLENGSDREVFLELRRRRNRF